MRPSRVRRAFTVVEVLVALVLMSVAAAGLASAITGDRLLRNAAAANSFAADRARERLEWLAALPCAGEASGADVAVWGAERWHASAGAVAWTLTDSLVLRGPAAPVVVEARVACPG